MLNTKH